MSSLDFLVYIPIMYIYLHIPAEVLLFLIKTNDWQMHRMYVNKYVHCCQCNHLTAVSSSWLVSFMIYLHANLQKYVLRHDKMFLRELWPDTNRPAQPQKRANLEISAKESRDIILSKQWTTKALIRLCRCAGWSAPLLFAYDTFSHGPAHIIRHQVQNQQEVQGLLTWAVSQKKTL